MINGASDIAIRITADGTLMVQGFNAAEASSKQFAARVQGNLAATSASMDQLAADTRLVRNAMAGLAAGRIVGDLLDGAAAAQQTALRLQNLSGSALAYAQNQRYLSETAGKFGADLQTLSDSYTRILALQNAGVVSGTQGRQILEGMANAAAFLGASSAQTGQAMFGLSQGLTAGTLRAEELNQVTEPLPGLLQKLDQAAGLPAGGFRKLVNDGQVTSAMFRDTLIKALDEYSGAASRNADSVQGSLNRIGNAGTEMQRSLASALQTPLALFAGLTEAVGHLMGSPHMGALIGGTAAAGMVLYGSSMVRSALAAREATAAQNQLAMMTLRTTQARQQAAIATLEEARAESIATGNTAALVRAHQELAVANAEVAAAARNAGVLHESQAATALAAAQAEVAAAGEIGIAQAASSANQARAALSAADAKLVNAQADFQLALAELGTVEASRAATAGFMLEKGAVDALTLAQGRWAATAEAVVIAETEQAAAAAAAAAAETRLAAAQTAVATTAGEAAAGSGILGGAMAALGGPMTVALTLLALAVPLVSSFAATNDEAAAALQRSRQTLHEHAEAIESSSARRRTAITVTQEQVQSEQDWQQQLAKSDASQAQMEIARLNRMRFEQREKLALLETEANARRQIAEALAGDRAGGGAREDAEKAAAAAKEQAAAVQELDDKLKLATAHWTALGEAAKAAANQKLEASRDEISKYNEGLRERIGVLGLSGTALENHRLKMLLDKQASDDSKKTTSELRAEAQALTDEINRQSDALEKKNKAKREEDERAQQGLSIGQQLIAQYNARLELDTKYAAAQVQLRAGYEQLVKIYGKAAPSLNEFLKLEKQDHDAKVAALDPLQKMIDKLDEETHSLREKVNARAADNREAFIQIGVDEALSKASDKNIQDLDAEIAKIREKRGALYDLQQQQRSQEQIDSGARQASGAFGNMQASGDMAEGMDYLSSFDPVGALQVQQDAQSQLMQEFYQEKQDMLDLDYELGLTKETDYNAQKTALIMEQHEAEKALKQQHEDELSDIHQRGRMNELMWDRLTAQQKVAVSMGAMGQLTAAIANYQQASHRNNKKAAKATAIIGGAAGIARAWGEMPWPMALVATAAIALNTAAQIRTIDSANIGGGGGTPAASVSAPAATPPQQSVPDNITTTTTVGQAGTTTTVVVAPPPSTDQNGSAAPARAPAQASASAAAVVDGSAYSKPAQQPYTIEARDVPPPPPAASLAVAAPSSSGTRTHRVELALSLDLSVKGKTEAVDKDQMAAIAKQAMDEHMIPMLKEKVRREAMFIDEGSAQYLALTEKRI